MTSACYGFTFIGAGEVFNYNRTDCEKIAWIGKKCKGKPLLFDICQLLYQGSDFSVQPIKY